MHQALSVLHKLSKVVQQVSFAELNLLFDEFDFCQTLVSLLSAILAELLKLDGNFPRDIYKAAQGIKNSALGAQVLQALKSTLQAVN